MATPAINRPHVRLDTHPTHPSAVIASLTGAQQDLARRLLIAGGFEALDDHTLVMARIDREEPYWANKTAQTLTAEGITTQITNRLREAIDEEWEWCDYPLPWCTREEVREVSDDAQKIYDDIRHGRLLIHAHAKDHSTTVAIGTYLDTGECVYLHGQDHLRHIANTFAPLPQGVRRHGSVMNQV